MCGIAGCVVAEGERPPLPTLERMADALAHRGPDDRGIEVAGNVGLVHTRLAIIDPSAAGHQPMADSSGRWLLTYNGEVFNHAELRTRLPGTRYRGGSDTETLLHALAQWGEDAIPRLNGQFAFAAADRDGGRLLLVRDHFGIKPLYLARHDGAVWFASEIGALLAAGVPRRARPELLAHTVRYAWPAGAATPVADVERVPPGGAVSVDLQSLRTEQRLWYVPTDAVNPQRAAELAGRSRAQLTELVEGALRRAVRRQLMADVPVGTTCSGGVDSSIITALAREVQPRIVAYTVTIEGDPATEVYWTRKVTNHLGIELECEELSASDWRAALVPAVRHHEYPLHPAGVPVARIAAAARVGGVKVLLTGEGSDELFGGYPGLHRRLYRDSLPLRMRLRRGGDALRGMGLGRLPRTAARVLARGLPRLVRRSSGAPDPLPPAEHSDGVRRELEGSSLEAYAHHPGAEGRLEAALLAGLSSNPLPWLLNRMDKNGLQSSVEARVPFLDPDLVGLVVNLPLAARLGPQPKGILRDAARRALPKRVATRPKHVGLQADTRRLIGDAARPGFWEDGHFRDLLGVPQDAWRNRIRTLTSTEMVRLCTAEIWCRVFLDAEDDSSVEADLWR